MRRSPTRRLALTVGALVAAFAFGLASPDPARVAAAAKDDPFIVVLRDGVPADRWETANLARLGLKPAHRYRHAVHGFAARLTGAQRRALEADPAVAFVERDRLVELADLLPTGVDRAEADLSPAARIDGVDGDGQRVDADIAIIDTGIQSNHPDLNVAGGYNCTTSDRTAWSDWNGHGTHVAGTAAALDNGLGVVGVAPGARLWSVRVFRDSTAARLSWIVCGIDWVTAQVDPLDPTKPLIEVVNMSLRDEGRDDGACGAVNGDAEHAAICRSVDRGVTYVVAAGNDSNSAAAWRPASYNEVVTVSALADFDGKAGGLAAATCSSYGQLDRDDTFADFSNYGSDVDIIAPGKCIRSTYRGSSYATISGTSMAAPAVAGGAALYRALHPEASPSHVRAALRAAGSLDWATSTDPDRIVDPLLDVSSFGAAPGFRLDLLAASRSVWAGGAGTAIPLRLVRGNGFADQVDLTVVDAPPGVAATLDQPALVGLGGLTATLSVSAEAGAPAGTSSIIVRGTSGAIVSEDTVSITVGVDTVDPTVVPPDQRILRPGTLGPGVPVRLGWSASDAESGVALIELFESRDGRAYSEVGLPSAKATSTTRRLSLGHHYRHRVRARDASGRVSDWGTGRTFGLAGFYERHRTVSYRGTWATAGSSNAWGGALRYTRSKGARATFRFSGSEVAWVAPRSPGRGYAKVWVDGTYVSRVNLYSSSARSRQIVFTRAWSTYGTHTVTIVNEATAGRPRIDIDGFVVLR